MLPGVDDADFLQPEPVPQNRHEQVHVILVLGHEGLKISASNQDLNLKARILKFKFGKLKLIEDSC